MKEFQVNRIITNSPEETKTFAKEIAGLLNAGAIVLLTGDLGAGKTVFAKGFAEGLGVKDEVTSPTFTIMNIYDNKMNHFDLYRLESVEEFLAIGAEEELYSDKISLVEWPEKVGFNFFPRDAVVVSIFKRDEKMREIIMSFNEGK